MQVTSCVSREVCYAYQWHTAGVEVDVKYKSSMLVCTQVMAPCPLAPLYCMYSWVVSLLVVLSDVYPSPKAHNSLGFNGSLLIVCLFTGRTAGWWCPYTAYTRRSSSSSKTAAPLQPPSAMATPAAAADLVPAAAAAAAGLAAAVAAAAERQSAFLMLWCLRCALRARG